MMPARPFILALGLVAVIAGTAERALADHVELRRSIRRAAATEPVRLEDVARLEGDAANRFRHLVVIPVEAGSVDRPCRIDVSEVRRLLDEAGADWPNLELRGGTVVVRPAHDADRVAVSNAATALRIDGDAPILSQVAEDWRPVTDWSTSRTLGRPIARAVQQAMEWFEPDSSRLLCSIDRRPLERLPEMLTGVQVVPVTPLEQVGPADRLVFRVSGFDEGGIRRCVNVAAEIKVLRLAPVATDDIRRGRSIRGDGANVRIELRPVRPSEVVDGIDAIAGRKVLEAVPAGTVLVPGLFEPETIVSRNASIQVRTVVHDHEIRFEMKCLEDGCLGQLVKCAGPDGRPVMARVVGPNRAEVVADR